MDVEAIPLEEDAKKEKSDKNIYEVSTEDEKKANSENMEALSTEDESKYASSKSMVSVTTEENAEEATTEFDICNHKLPMEDGFLPWTPLKNLL